MSVCVVAELSDFNADIKETNNKERDLPNKIAMVLMTT